MRFLLIVLICFLFPVAGVLAVSDSFNIGTLIGNDTNAPTTPVITGLTPITATQINVVWSASSDDVVVLGYRVFRNSVQIATTTLLSFSDVGLVPNSSYSYSVDAFDQSFNYSSSSLVLSTTTLSLPPIISTSTPSNTGGSKTNLVDSFSIIPSFNDVILNWTTNMPAQYILTWGRTASYELGSVSGLVYAKQHQAFIDKLEPGTKYYFKLLSVDDRGYTRVVKEDSFVTLEKNDGLFDVLPNVSNFAALVEDDGVRLSWQNKFDKNNYFVRVVRSHLFFPDSIAAGLVVYEGSAESWFDKNALANKNTQYYTVFVMDKEGRVSSGAVAKVIKDSVIDVRDTEVDDGGTGLKEDFDSTVLSPVSVKINQADLSQNIEKTVVLDKDSDFLISIPVTAVTRGLKTIIVTVENPTNQKEVTSYLLKINNKGDAYEALIPAFLVLGESRITIEVFDYKYSVVRRISNNITITDLNIRTPFFPDKIVYVKDRIVAYWWVIILIIVSRFLYKKLF